MKHNLILFILVLTYLAFTKSIAQPSIHPPSTVVEDASNNPVTHSVLSNSFELSIPDNFKRIKLNKLRKHAYSKNIKCSDGFSDGLGTFFNFYETTIPLKSTDNGMTVWRASDEFVNRFGTRHWIASGYRVVNRKDIYFIKLITDNKKSGANYVVMLFTEHRGKMLHALFQTPITDCEKWDKVIENFVSSLKVSSPRSRLELIKNSWNFSLLK